MGFQKSILPREYEKSRETPSRAFTILHPSPLLNQPSPLTIFPCNLLKTHDVASGMWVKVKDGDGVSSKTILPRAYKGSSVKLLHQPSPFTESTDPGAGSYAVGAW